MYQPNIHKTWQGLGLISPQSELVTITWITFGALEVAESERDCGENTEIQSFQLHSQFKLAMFPFGALVFNQKPRQIPQLLPFCFHVKHKTITISAFFLDQRVTEAPPRSASTIARIFKVTSFNSGVHLKAQNKPDVLSTGGKVKEL